MTARLVAVGEVESAYQTLFVTYASGEPLWHPQASEERFEPDPSDYRKQQAEAEIAGY